MLLNILTSIIISESDRDGITNLIEYRKYLETKQERKNKKRKIASVTINCYVTPLVLEY